MEITKETVLDLIGKINSRMPDNRYPATKYLVSLFFDTPEDERKRLEIEAEWKTDHEALWLNCDDWKKRLEFRNASYKAVEEVILALSAEGLIVLERVHIRDNIPAGQGYYLLENAHV